MKLFIFTGAISLLFFVHCSQKPVPGKYRSPGEIADAVKGENRIVAFCEGKDCCSEHKDCRRQCDQVFYKSDDRVRKKCRALPINIVTQLDDLLDTLQSPVQDDLERLDLSQDFRLLLAMDYQVWVRVAKEYTVDEGREVLMWLSQNLRPVEELLQLTKEAQNEIIYEILASAGDRLKPGPVEEGLSRKISLDDSFFKLMVDRSNYDLLQITHNMIKEDLCAVQYAGESQTERCVLRIYCKEKPGRDNEYVHSEDLRNEMARNIDDESFFDYVQNQILRIHSNLGVSFSEPIMNNQVCFVACNDSNKGCE